MNIKRSHRKRYVVLSLLGLVIIAAVVIVLWVFSSNTGQVIDASSQKDSQLAPYLTYDGTYISFNYKSVYQAHDEHPEDGSLELVSLNASTNYEKRLSVAVQAAPVGGMETISAYQMRKTQPAVYTSQQLTTDAGKAVAWLKNDGTEDTIFIAHGDKVATLSFATVGRVDDLQTEANILLSSFQWKARQ